MRARRGAMPVSCAEGGAAAAPFDLFAAASHPMRAVSGGPGFRKNGGAQKRAGIISIAIGSAILRQPSRAMTSLLSTASRPAARSSDQVM